MITETVSRESQALDIVRGYLGWSSGAGLIPVPGLDIAAVVGVNVRMLQQLAKLYDVPFKENLAKSLAGSLLSGAGALMLTGPAASLVKLVPLVGSLAGMLVMPALAAGATWATGKVFIQHFESGGTFLDFDPSKVRAHYAEEFKVAPKERA
jgi:uncharacterized protein (DUF697 family)